VNKLVLSGRIKKIEPLRYTPPGLPLLSLVIEHAAENIEAGMKRKVECEMNAVAIGEITNAPLTEGNHIQATGFLAKRSVNSTQLVLHIQHIEQL